MGIVTVFPQDEVREIPTTHPSVFSGITGKVARVVVGTSDEEEDGEEEEEVLLDN